MGKVPLKRGHYLQMLVKPLPRLSKLVENGTTMPLRAPPAAACFIALTFWAVTAQATLGEPFTRGFPSAPSTTTGVNAQKSTALRTTSATGWSKQQTTLESGTIVQEFSNSSGIVFAVSWQGPVLPDLNALLGQYFATYARTALQAREARRFGGAMQINDPGLVMHSGGRMRSFSGFAYVPALVPAGVSIEALLP